MITVRTRRVLACLFAITFSMPVVGLVILRLLGLAAIYSVPSNGMAPAIRKGDNIFAEGLTYLLHKPARGDIITFRY